MISFEIISKGSMLIKHGSRTALVQGELIFDPPTFYVSSHTLNKWEEDKVDITDMEKKEIIEFLTMNQQGTKIIVE